MARECYFHEVQERLIIAKDHGWNYFKEQAVQEHDMFVRSYHLPSELQVTSVKCVTHPVSSTLYPSDAPNNLVPTYCYGDGNCLYRAASMLLFGDPEHHIELRVRVNCELTSNEDQYLNAEAMTAASSCDVRNLINTIKECSLSDAQCTNTITNGYRNDIMASFSNGIYANLWHLYGLATVTGLPVMSIYPIVQNCAVPRKLFNQTIYPVTHVRSSNSIGNSYTHKMYIMWTHTVHSNTLNWTANHFVPCIPRHLTESREQQFTTGDQVKAGPSDQFSAGCNNTHGMYLVF